MVILSKEGLSELTASGRIAAGSEVELATVLLAAAVRQGAPKPDVSSVDAFKRALLGARQVVLPGSTGGIYMKNEVFPRLGIADKVSLKMVPRGTDSTAMLAAGEADLAIGPVSETRQSARESNWSARFPMTCSSSRCSWRRWSRRRRNPEAAKKLIAFLASDETTTAIKNSGMQPVGDRRKP